MPRRALWLTALLACGLGLATWRLAPRVPTTADVPAPASGARRVVSLAPSLTEIVYALGAGDRLVGVSEYSDYPPAAKKVPRVGAFLNPNLELIADLKADLVLIQGQHEKVRDYCRTHGQAFFSVKLDTVDDLFGALGTVGAALGRPAAAQAEVERLRAGLDRVRQAVRGRPAPKVFVSLGRPAGPLTNLTTCGPGTFLHEVLTLAGGANVFGDARELYPVPSLEVLTQRAPDVILDLQGGRVLDAAGVAATQAEWRPLATLPAVRDGRIAVITEDYSMIPGPRVDQLAARVARVLHPETSGSLP
jgi:iron complex transport system substrate-binding protein